MQTTGFRRWTPNKASTVFMLFKGKMTPLEKPRLPKNANFVIVCKYGDWSGFRTLEECEKQFPELEGMGKEDGYYWVEER